MELRIPAAEAATVMPQPHRSKLRKQRTFSIPEPLPQRKYMGSVRMGNSVFHTQSRPELAAAICVDKLRPAEMKGREHDCTAPSTACWCSG